MTAPAPTDAGALRDSHPYVLMKRGTGRAAAEALAPNLFVDAWKEYLKKADAKPDQIFAFEDGWDAALAAIARSTNTDADLAKARDRIEKEREVREQWVQQAHQNAQVADRLAKENARLREALEKYADPEIYQPHPHGLAFDCRDLSHIARSALTDGASAHDR